MSLIGPTSSHHDGRSNYMMGHNDGNDTIYEDPASSERNTQVVNDRRRINSPAQMIADYENKFTHLRLVFEFHFILILKIQNRTFSKTNRGAQLISNSKTIVQKHQEHSIIETGTGLFFKSDKKTKNDFNIKF